MDQTEKLLIGIENILSVASDLVDEVARLKNVEEECKILKEKIFMNQLTKAEQEVFALTIDGHSISEMQDILHKEECTIKSQKRSILKKLSTPSMTEAVQQFQNLY
jgi:DNA-binding NarL/FixJ family response regulator